LHTHQRAVASPLPPSEEGEGVPFIIALERRRITVPGGPEWTVTPPSFPPKKPRARLHPDKRSRPPLCGLMKPSFCFKIPQGSLHELICHPARPFAFLHHLVTLNRTSQGPPAPPLFSPPPPPVPFPCVGPRFTRLGKKQSNSTDFLLAPLGRRNTFCALLTGLQWRADTDQETPKRRYT